MARYSSSSVWTRAQAAGVLVTAVLLSVAQCQTQQPGASSSAMPNLGAHAAHAEHPTTAAPVLRADPQDVATFFNIKGDLTKITWAHAVNSKELLDKSLNDSSIMMLEADVILGTTNESSSQEPVMGHPPDTTSDLSLQEFLRTVITYNKDNNASRKGVKLDFKSIDVFEKAIDSLPQTISKTPSFPVWLNADILPGPVNATAKPVDAQRFLTKAKAEYPSLTLSLGWTTRWGKGLGNDTVSIAPKYDNQTVERMLEELHRAGVSAPITYAVRAAFVANSLDELQTLLNGTHQANGQATLTVWSSDETDIVDVDKLRTNILAIGKDRIYLDVGEKLSKDLDLSSSALTTCASVATTLLASVLVLLRAL